MARRGRKRREGPREPNGRAQRGPQNDPVVAAIRQRRIVATEFAWAAKDSRSDFALGLANIQRLVGDDEYLAALDLARDWRMLYPQAAAPSCLGNIAPSDPDAGDVLPMVRDEDCGTPDKRCGVCATCIRLRARERSRLAESRACAASLHGWVLLKRLALYDEPGEWHDMERARGTGEWAASETALKSVRRALRALVTVYNHRVEPGVTAETVRDAWDAFQARRVARLAAEARDGDKTRSA